MMRKYVWTGTALAVLTLAGTYLAADRAARCPDSFLGRCANTFKNWAPVFGCGDTAGRTAAVTTEARATTPCAPTRPVEAENAFEPFAVEPTIPPTETTEPPLVNPQAPAAEESDAPVPAMPLCPEDENVTGRRMPYADQDEEWEFGLEWPMPQSGPARTETDEPNREEVNKQTDLNPIEESEILPDTRGFREDPHRDHHYPSCPYTGSGRCPTPQPRSLPPSAVPPIQPVGPPSPPNSATPNH